MGQNVLLTGKSTQDRTKVVEIEVDPSGSLVTVTHEHAKVHSGLMFGAGHIVTGVASGASLNMIIQTPTDASMHLYIKTLATADATFYAFRSPTYTGGTVVPSINHNETNTNTSDAVFLHTPALTLDGTPMWAELLPAGQGGSAPGAVGHPTTEQVVLAADSEYLFRLTNDDGAGQSLQIVFSFYEGPA